MIINNSQEFMIHIPNKFLDNEIVKTGRKITKIYRPMPKILLPSRGSTTPMNCEGKKAPVARGSYFEFEISNEEYKFWKGITNEERETLRDEAFKRCFYDVLKEYMQTHAKKATGPFGTSQSSPA